MRLKLSHPWLAGWRRQARRIVTGSVSLVVVGTLLFGASKDLVFAASDMVRTQVGNLQAALQGVGEPDGPLTDMAGPQPEVDVSAAEAPDQRLKALGLDPVGQVEPGALPEGMDLLHPPEWTTHLAMPGVPVPPDPAVAPGQFIDPLTGLAYDPQTVPPCPASDPKPDDEKDTTPPVDEGLDADGAKPCLAPPFTDPALMAGEPLSLTSDAQPWLTYGWEPLPPLVAPGSEVVLPPLVDDLPPLPDPDSLPTEPPAIDPAPPADETR